MVWPTRDGGGDEELQVVRVTQRERILLIYGGEPAEGGHVQYNNIATQVTANYPCTGANGHQNAVTAVSGGRGMRTKFWAPCTIVN